MVQLRVLQISVAKICLTQPGFPQGGACQPGSLEKSAAQIRVVEISCRKVVATQKRPAQIRAPEGASDEIGVLEIRLLATSAIPSFFPITFQQVSRSLTIRLQGLAHTPPVKSGGFTRAKVSQIARIMHDGARPADFVIVRQGLKG